MPWHDQIFSYCERGQSGLFWAEPLNAFSNGLFVLVAVVAGVTWLRQPIEQRGTVQAILIGLVGLIGIGSFAFHTYATRWAMVADVAPITAFMFVYLAFALRQFLGWSWIGVTLGAAGFAALLAGAESLPCPASWSAAVAGSRCLNGSLGYVPALAMLMVVGLLAMLQSQRVGAPMAGRALLAAGGVFAISLVARTLDLTVCDATRLFGQPLGTHFIWHSLNSVTLGLLLAAALAFDLREGDATPAPT
jgi:Ceramidase